MNPHEDREEAPGLFVSCSKGLEPILQEELKELGFLDTTLRYCGVHVADSTAEAIYRINYCSRIGSRVLLPLKRFRCRDAQALYRNISEIDWFNYIPKGMTIAVDANVDHPEIRNSLYAAQVVKDAICDQFRKRSGTRPSVNVQDPDVQLNLFVYRDYGIINIDTSGVPLHKRGYRQESLEAPIRETLAAAILRLASYQGDEILLDPCCGSGTVLIEAALMATRTAPGYLRHHWAFMYLPQFSQQTWLQCKINADNLRIPIQPGHFFGTDINKNAVRVCRSNLRAAGFHQAIEVTQADFRTYQPSIVPNLLVSNPPHGKRLDDVEMLRPLYRDLGDFMKQCLAKPSRGFIFTGNLELAKEVGLAAKQRHVLDNSGVESRLLEFDIY